MTRLLARPGATSTGRSAERGQVLVVAMLFLTVLLGASALALDVGRWLVTKRDFQNQVDAAVLAGAQYLDEGTSDKQANARQAAWASLKQQLGLALDPATLAAANTGAATPYLEAGLRIWVDSPATAAGAKYPGRRSGGKTVFALVERDDHALLGGLVGGAQATIGAWATAGRDRYQFGLEVLCPMGDPRCPGNVQDLKIAGGTQGSIKVPHGDVGSDWGLQITSNSAPGLIVQDGDVYLMELNPGSDWNPPPATTGGVNPGLTPVGPNVWPDLLGSLIPVPVWEPPSWIDQTAGGVCATKGCAPLRSDFTCGGGGKTPACGGILNPQSTTVSCDATAPHLAPGTYDNLTVNAGCAILDPAPPGYTQCTQVATTPVPSTVGLCYGQTPGIFHIRKSLNIGSGQSSAFLIGDGVTIILDAGAKVTFGNSGGLILDSGNALGTTTDWSRSAWTTSAASPWPACALSGTSTTTACVATSAYGSTNAAGLGLTIDVRPPGISNLSGGCGSSIGTLTMNGTFGIQFSGALFAPCTNVSMGASPYQGTVGAIVAWTLNYNGQTQLQVRAIAPAVVSPPFLLEPTLGQ